MNSHVIPAIALTIAVGIFFGYVKPTWSGPITATKAAIVDDEQALVVAGEYTSKQSELNSARIAIDPEDLTRFSVFLPDSVDNIGLILDINALAARSGISLANIDVVKSNYGGTGNNAKATVSSGAPPAGALPVARTNSVGSIDLSLSAVGTYAALQAFLTGIERSARLLDVRDITVKGSDTGVYSYQMTVRLYWLR